MSARVFRTMFRGDGEFYYVCPTWQECAAGNLMWAALDERVWAADRGWACYCGRPDQQGAGAEGVVGMSVETFPEVMVTAHRKLPRGAVDEWLGQTITDVMGKLVGEHGLERATSGLATGGDTVWGEVAMAGDVPLRAAIPYPGQPLDGTDGHFGPRWTKAQQADWAGLRQYAEITGGVHEVHDRDPRTSAERVRMLHKRNDWMLEHTQAVVAIWAPANLNSGTASCLRKAAGAGKPIILVNLATRRVTRPRPEHWARYLNMPALARQ